MHFSEVFRRFTLKQDVRFFHGPCEKQICTNAVLQKKGHIKAAAKRYVQACKEKLKKGIYKDAAAVKKMPKGICQKRAM